MTNRLVDPLRLERPVRVARRAEDGEPARPPSRRRPKRASSWSALLGALVAALVLVPLGFADDDDGDDNGSTPITVADVCLAAAGAGNLVVNGDFEQPAAGPAIETYPPLPGPAGWQVTTPSVDRVHQSYWEAACGVRSIDLTGSPGQGTLVQNVAGTLAGQRYRLLFAAAANPDPLCDPLMEPTTVTAQVRWGGTPVTTLTFTRTADNVPPLEPAWEPFQATVVGQAGSTLLEFDSNSGNFCGVAIDAVSVTPIAGDDDDDDDGDDHGDDDGDDGDDDDDGGDDDGDDG
jgi:hypothetical protein